jgi:hypothetical protein
MYQLAYPFVTALKLASSMVHDLKHINGWCLGANLKKPDMNGRK